MGEMVLLTGASSFTGLWIAEALADAGFSVVAPLRRARSDYDGERLARIERLQRSCEVVFSAPFASPAFMDIVRTRRPAALAHHAAEITGYRDADFDAVAAFQKNASGAPKAVRELGEAGVRALVITGTVFEAGEGGVASEPLAVTPYGLSKTLTSLAFRHFAADAGLGFGRVVVPSPYGAYEQARSFPAYLFRSWRTGETPQVRTPRYLRDHLPAPLLGRAYARYLRRLLDEPTTPLVCRPSGWVAAQGDFALRVAKEAAARLGRECPVTFAEQSDFSEPLRRVNDEPVRREGWDEAEFWDAYVGWYRG